MKVLLKFGLVALMSFALFSCDLDDDDAYSLGKFWVGFGLVENVDSDDSGFTIKMDDGSVLFPVNSYYSWHHKEYDRVLVNYTIIGDKRIDDDNEEYYVKINSLRDILYKEILDITPEIEDSIGNDPIHVLDVWQSSNLLTFELDYYGYNKVHFINLVKPPGVLTIDTPVQLELRHNNRDDEPKYKMSAFVTFDLESLQIAGRDSVEFEITGDDFGGEGFSYSGVYRY